MKGIIADCKRIALETRKAHFKLGYDRSGSVTTYIDSYPQFSSDYKENRSRNELPKVGVRNSNFVFGTDKNENCSLYSTNFEQKKSGPLINNKKIVAESKTAHYKLGYDNDKYKTVYGQSYHQNEQLQYKRARGQEGDHTFFNVNKTYMGGWSTSSKPEKVNRSPLKQM